jgi:hypothetical protein
MMAKKLRGQPRTDVQRGMVALMVGCGMKMRDLNAVLRTAGAANEAETEKLLEEYGLTEKRLPQRATILVHRPTRMTRSQTMRTTARLPKRRRMQMTVMAVAAAVSDTVQQAHRFMGR